MLGSSQRPLIRGDIQTLKEIKKISRDDFFVRMP